MEQLFTFSIFSENRVGLLNQISIIFTRRSVNIETLSVSPSSIPGIHKFTITACCTPDMAKDCDAGGKAYRCASRILPYRR